MLLSLMDHSLRIRRGTERCKPVATHQHPTFTPNT